MPTRHSKSLAQRGELSPDTLIGWRKIIGLRNALVHDYLNIDPEIIRSVIGQGYMTSCLPLANRARLVGCPY